MKWILYSEEKNNYVLPVCEPCLDGKHLSYGDDHRLGEADRRDCKNTGETGKGLVQCNCNEEWSGLYEAIEKGIERVYDSEESAEKAKLELIAEAGEEGK